MTRKPLNRNLFAVDYHVEIHICLQYYLAPGTAAHNLTYCDVSEVTAALQSFFAHLHIRRSKTTTFKQHGIPSPNQAYTRHIPDPDKTSLDHLGNPQIVEVSMQVLVVACTASPQHGDISHYVNTGLKGLQRQQSWKIICVDHIFQ